MEGALALFPVSSYLEVTLLETFVNFFLGPPTTIVTQISVFCNILKRNYVNNFTFLNPARHKLLLEL